MVTTWLLVPGAGDRPDAVVVGQSLGGFTAVEVARRLQEAPPGPTTVRRLVLVNAMIPAVGETPGQWWTASGREEAKRAAERAAGREGAGFLVRALVDPDRS